jgi:hypothetical protein
MDCSLYDSRYWVNSGKDMPDVGGMVYTVGRTRLSF